MRIRLSLILVAVFLGATAIAAAPPEPNVDDTHRLDIAAHRRVAVHVYSQVTDFTADDEQRSLEVAREVFSTASIDVAWTICAPGVCVTPSADALKLRIVLSADRGASYSGVLGNALIDSQARAGVLATVFIDRTRRLAHDLGIDYRVLLGRAIAHELGHLLLGTSAHGTGLMRELWSHDELLGTRRDDWILDPLDAAAVRDRLARRAGKRSRGAS
jgi:hypothetical protein